MNAGRRLSDKLLAAHQQACEEKNGPIANKLLEALHIDLSRIGGEKLEYREDLDAFQEAFDNHHKIFGTLTLNFC